MDHGPDVRQLHRLWYSLRSSPRLQNWKGHSSLNVSKEACAGHGWKVARSGNRLDVDRQQVIQDRRSGVSLTQVANKHGLSRASVCPLMKEAGGNSVLPVSLDGANIAEEAHV